MKVFFTGVCSITLWIFVFSKVVNVYGLSAEQEAEIRERLNLPEEELSVDTIVDTSIPGIFEVQLTEGPLIYVTSDVRHFFLGDIYSIKETGLVNLSEQRRDIKRLELLAQVEEDDMIVFSPAGEVRSAITVFTDITCFYCQKLHREVPQLNESGVEVRYLAFARGGVGSDGFRKLASAWCAQDQQDTLTRLKAGEILPDNVCPGNPVSEQLSLGKRAGVRGTPAIITEDGKMIPGYRSADDIVASLEGK